ncbi:L-threonylcarbamoyladenylate synthase [Candidatus Anaplasma sp. TIGMIC]|uniref:L-threonylcarbamoyladenylate synthase n=1 Tax=Candidatus Anaplasma sp. TIGMIC TaxID=3020713 RepID=UPI0023300B89|nr:L-threonylcarbamoyladenylate synthase [Candidatus Anaplasma sp. TIGMIC]MDB1135079.1 L-threonylcarbamoyladenylate synthase [Candidatus Anaplasma sp. TIGMIC]
MQPGYVSVIKEEVLEKVVCALRRGELVCFPTETVYALACSALCESAVHRLYEVKQREPEKPFSIMLSDAKQIREFADVRNCDMEIVNVLSPGPVTFILPISSTQNLPRGFFKDTLGVRIPDHALAREVLKRFEYPVVATSANLSGMHSAARASDVPHEIRKSVAEFLEDDSSVNGVCSTVFEVASRKILRNGMLTKQKILNAIGIAEKQYGLDSGACLTKESSS